MDDVIMKRAITQHMIKITTPNDPGAVLYELMQKHQKAAEELYRQAFSDGYRQRDSDKIIEQIAE